MRKSMIALAMVAMFALSNSTDAFAKDDAPKTADTIVQYSFYIPFVGYYYWEYTVKGE